MSSNTDLVTSSTDGTPVTTSLAIAEGTDVQHKNVMETIRTYLPDLEEFGRVAFETRPFETAGGMQQREIALLNEQQATLILTYMRNSDIVRGFKKRLVKAFYDMKQAITSGAVAVKQKKVKTGPSATEKKLMMDCYKLVINELPNLGAASKQLLLSATVAGVFGEQLLPKPEVAKSYSAKDISEELGISAQMVGIIANANGLKTDENGAYVLDKSKYSSKQVESFRYNEAGRAAVIEAFNKRKNANETAANESATEEVA